MIRPFALYVGLRYTRAKRRNHFISFISLVSMLGIALGVMVLITVLSVMNGFDYQIRSRFFAIAPEVTVLASADHNDNWLNLRQRVHTLSQVVNSAPFINGQGMLNHRGMVNGVEVVGIVPHEENKISQLGVKMTHGSLASLTPGSFNMVIGQKLADQLGLIVGDKINLFTPHITATPVGVFPQFRRFTISGIFSTNSGFGFDSDFAYISLPDAQRLFPSPYGMRGLHIKLNNIYAAQAVSQQLQRVLPSHFIVTNWTQQYGPFFNAIAMEKTIMFVILLLIIAVAAFNLVATLVMIVNEKRADIAILRTLGARPRTIVAIFVIQGAVVGIIGTLLGIIGGVVLALNATAIVNYIQQLFHVQFLTSSVYFVDFLPSRLEWYDVVNVAWIACGLSLLATLYPASVAFRTQPVEALRYE